MTADRLRLFFENSAEAMLLVERDRLVDCNEAALKHEQFVTASINSLFAVAAKENDFATQTHLHWFIDEQVEEEKTASEIVDLFTRAGDHEAAILMLDQNLGKRTGESEGEGE